MKLGFIGLGNMASAIIGGILSKGLAAPADILGADPSVAAQNKAREQLGITLCTENTAVAEAVDVLFLAVKPNYLGSVIEEIKGSVSADTIVVSIAAGRTLEFMQKAFGEVAAKVVRCMPNTPALVLEGCTAVTPGAYVTEQETKTVLTLLSAFGKAHVVPEKLMDAVVGVSGSSPAYVFLFIEAMADAAVAAGMPRNQAYEFAAQAVYGSAKMVLETGMHPAELKDMVCSPGGTTIEAVRVLEETGFRGSIMAAIEACVEKSKNL